MCIRDRVQVEGARGAGRGPGEHQLLHPGLHGDPDLPAVDGAPGDPLEVVGEDGRGGQYRQHGHVRGDQHPAAAPAQVAAEQPQDQPAADGRVDGAGEHGAGELAEHREQQEREGEAADEGAHVVGGEQVRDGPARVLSADALDEDHQQRDLRTDEHPDGEGEGDERGAGLPQPGETRIQRHGREPAQKGEPGLDGGEAEGGPVAEAFGEQGADPHGEDHDGQHDRRLGDGVADEVSAQGEQLQLVHEPAGGADEHGGQDEESAGPGPYGQGGRDGRGAPRLRSREYPARDGTVDHAANRTSPPTYIRSPTWVQVVQRSGQLA